MPLLVPIAVAVVAIIFLLGSFTLEGVRARRRRRSREQPATCEGGGSHLTSVR